MESESRLAIAARWLQPATDLLFPPACTFCAVSLSKSTTPDQALLCDDCRLKIPIDDGDACIRCGLPIGPFVDSTDGCIRCRRRRFRFWRVVRLGVYEDALREACIRGKSAGTEPLSAALALLLLERKQEMLNELQPDLIVPVPQHWWHRAWRPHHQANTIADVIARRMELPVHEKLLRKRRLTRDQSSLPRIERQRNLSKAFEVRRGINLKGKRVLLVDDILTTGTTANEAARALGERGARSVSVAVLAVVR